jgi:hypothetical protein
MRILPIFALAKRANATYDCIHVEISPIFVSLALIAPVHALAAVVSYSITVTTAFASGDPFPDRIDSAFTEPDTGYFQILNTGDTTFSGLIGTIAVSAFAGDLSFTSNSIVLAPGASVSVAIPYNSNDVGGFNGPAYDYRPGVEIALNGTMSNGPLVEAIALLVADANIHSGVARTDTFGLTSDSFVLQGGDSWGFQNDDAFALGQADGVYVFTQSVTEPGSAPILVAGLTAIAFSRRRSVFRSQAA